ncbi:hypothetical protein BGZ67_005398 [Mortierella alpina]|nr:hypothetical protein BGZ67_005398 [Mortierella alpina]
MAKVAGTILWAPMAKLNSLQSHHPSQEPLSFKNAFRLARQVCQSSPRGGGVLSLWSDYGTTLRALLPYTMLYFAVYEQLKQLARRYLYETQDPAGEFRNRTCALQRGHRPPTEATPSPLGLGTYMSCVAAYQFHHPHEHDNNHNHDREYGHNYSQHPHERIRSAYNGDTSNLYTHVTTAIDQQRVQQGFKKSLPNETS